MKAINYNFNWLNEQVIELEISFNEQPTINQIKESLKDIKNKYRIGSIFNTFNPVKGIIYYSVFGWTGTYNVKLTIDDNIDYSKPFTDEPIVKNMSKPRRQFKL